MTVINALSTRGTIKGFDDNSSVNAQPSTDSAAMMFAAIFGGWINQVGQGDSGDQSNEPAGKEANSGRHALMGLDGLQGLMGMLQGNGDLQETFFQSLQGEGEQGAAAEEQLKFLLTQLDDLRSQTIPSNPFGNIEEVQLSGMTGQPQGNNAPQSELDLYKNVIANLLKEMSGEMKIDTHPPKEMNALAQQKSEIVAQRYNSGLFLAMDEQGQTQIAPSDLIKTPAQSLNQPVAQRDIKVDVSQGTLRIDDVEANQGTILAALSGKTKPSSDGFVQDENQVKTVADSRPEGTTTTKDSKILNLDQGNPEIPEEFALLKQDNSKNPSSPRGIAGEALEESDLPSLKGSAEKGRQENDNVIELNKAEKPTSQSFNLEGTGLNPAKDISQVQGRALDKSDQPIWNQVAREIFDNAYQARPHLREMTIQLHPEELGQISISMRWDEGQVHLRMVSSEAGTGQILQANFAELRDNLSQLGIQCGMMEMGLGEQKESSQEHQKREGSAHSQENREDSIEFLNTEELERMIDAEVGSQSVNRINVTA